MNIDDIHKSVSDMTDEELHEHLRRLRTARRAVPDRPKLDLECVENPVKPPKTSKPRKKKESSVPASSMLSLLGTLSPEQREQLLKELK